MRKMQRLQDKGCRSVLLYLEERGRGEVSNAQLSQVASNDGVTVSSAENLCFGHQQEPKQQ